ncbi:hypothetical protein ACXO23_00645 [Lactobacillus delbrueckii subsp. bulgaricus]
MICGASDGEIRQGTFHSRTGHWHEYITANSSVPETRSLVMINIDEQKRSQHK